MSPLTPITHIMSRSARVDDMRHSAACGRGGD